MTTISIVRVLHTLDVKALLAGKAVRLSLTGFEVEGALPGADPAGEVQIQLTLCPDLMRTIRPMMTEAARQEVPAVGNCHPGKGSVIEDGEGER